MFNMFTAAVLFFLGTCFGAFITLQIYANKTSKKLKAFREELQREEELHQKKLTAIYDKSKADYLEDLEKIRSLYQTEDKALENHLFGNDSIH
jgi:gas vesicle protein